MRRDRLGIAALVVATSTSSRWTEGTMKRHLPAFLIALAAALLWLAPPAWGTYGGPGSAPTQVGLYGDGADGAVTLGAGTTTITSDVHYTTLVVPNGATLAVNGCQVFSTTSITVQSGGTISAKGGNASSGTAGVGVRSIARLNPLGSLPSGAAGVGANSNGANSSSVLPYMFGGAGGAGGFSGIRSGGAPGTTISSFAAGAKAWAFSTGGNFNDSLTPLYLYGGYGGASGGNSSGSGASGAGGGGGGVVFLSSPTITVDSGGTITAAGGNGATGTAAACGGGGGGGGGAFIFRCRIYMNNGTATVSGGSGGAGAGGGTTGQNGADGRIYIVKGG